MSAARMALGALDGAVRKQAFLEAYGDCFLLISATLLAATVAVFFCKRPAGVGGAAH